ncbi:MAG: hypothetical protein QGI46_14690 [Planctomycetota bacterium]|nr:hypothetical protein [Planctomycetota bacterium]
MCESFAAAREAGLTGILSWTDAHLGGAFDFSADERALYRRIVESLQTDFPR